MEKVYSDHVGTKQVCYLDSRSVSSCPMVRFRMAFWNLIAKMSGIQIASEFLDIFFYVLYKSFWRSKIISFINLIEKNSISPVKGLFPFQLVFPQ